MAVPAITSLSPTTGPTGGKILVEILGSGFRLPPIPPTGPTDGIVPKTVDVQFDGVSATGVQVIADGRLTCLPVSHLAATVDVKIINLDDFGVPIGGEEVTEADGFDYALPSLTDQSDLTRLVRGIIREFKKQVLPNTVLTVSTEFDSDTGDMLNITDIAEHPGLILIGPSLAENRFYSVNAPQETPAPGVDEFYLRRPPKTVDLGFDIVGTSDNSVELLNLMFQTQQFFERNKIISMLRDAADPSKGSVEYEIEIDDAGDLKAAGRANISNVRNFSGSFTITGFDIEGIPDSLVDMATSISKKLVDEISLDDTEQLGVSFAVGVNPVDC